jgi:prevent-host-death family protein
MSKRSSAAAADESCLTTVEARAHLPEVLNRVAYGGERVRIGKRGKPLAVLVPLSDAELLERLEDEGDLRAARRALKEKGRSIPYSEARKRLGLR